MPSVDVAMVRSLRGGVLERLQDVVGTSIANEMQKRDLIGDAQQKASDVKTAFSSWDNCMQAAYCKWPVIAIIVVGSLFLISIITCIVRCACCGMSCCCSCFRCLKCGDCCGCCDPPGGRKHKYLDAPYVPPHHGYQQQAPMQASFPQQAPPRPMGGASGPPQYAEFDMAHKGADDSLPQMPSWDNAGSKKIMMEEEVEMDQLKPQTAEQKNPRDLHNGAPVSPMSADHRSAYGNHNSQGSSSTYASGAAGGAAAAAAYNQRTASPFAQRDQAQHPSRNNTYGPGQHNYQQNQGYQQPYGYQQNQGHGQNLAVASDMDQNRLSDGYGLDQPYDSPAVMPVAAIARHQSPAPSTHGQGFPQPASPAFAEMPSEPTAHSRSPHAGYAEMSSDMHGAQGQSASQHYAEMSAEPTMATQARNAPKTEAPQQHVFEMPTDQVAPVELDGGFVMPTASNHQAANELPGSDGHRTSPTSPARGAPEGYGMRRQGTGESAAGTFAARRGDNSPVSPDGYGMRRAGTGERSPAPLGGPAAYGADSRMRSSPAPRSPGPMSPASPMSPPGGRGPGGNPRNSPGPRRTPAPRGDYRYTPSPLNSPGPYGESPYARPPPQREAVNRSYSPGPQRPPLAHPTPVAPPALPPSSLESPPHSPITNNSGFDFTSGYSRPRTGTNEQNRSPAEQRPSDGRDGYPGFKPYNPNQNAYNGH